MGDWIAPAEAMSPLGGASSDWRRAARDRERARAEQPRADPERASALWEGLISGRWSLIDHFDEDGKQFVVARRNGAAAGDARGLSRRERQVAEYLGLGRSLKAISVLLGIGASGVSNSAARASQKLGLRGSTGLAAFFAPGGVRARLTEFVLAGETLLFGTAPAIDRAKLADLSESERDVARDLVRGETIAAIASRRGTTLLTVDTQVKAIYAKLRVGSRVQLASQLSSHSENG